jgi:hypothetical protein
MAWTIPAAPRLYGEFRASWLEELRLALVERATAAGWVVPVAWQTPRTAWEGIGAQLIEFETLAQELALGSSGAWVAAGGTADTGSFWGWADVTDFAARTHTQVSTTSARVALGLGSVPAIGHGGGWQIDHNWLAFYRELLDQMVTLVAYDARAGGFPGLITVTKQSQQGLTLPGTWSTDATDQAMSVPEWLLREQWYDKTNIPTNEYQRIERCKFLLYDTGVDKDIHAYVLTAKMIEPSITDVWDAQSSGYTEGTRPRFLHMTSVAAAATETDWSALGAATPNKVNSHNAGWRGALETVFFDFSSTFTYT